MIVVEIFTFIFDILMVLIELTKAIAVFVKEFVLGSINIFKELFQSFVDIFNALKPLFEIFGNILMPLFKLFLDFFVYVNYFIKIAVYSFTYLISLITSFISYVSNQLQFISEIFKTLTGIVMIGIDWIMYFLGAIFSIFAFFTNAAVSAENDLI